MNNLADLILSGLGASLTTGGISLFIFWRTSKQAPVTRRQVKNAWQAQSKELRDELTQLWTDRAAQYERTIAYLEAQLENRERGHE